VRLGLTGGVSGGVGEFRRVAGSMTRYIEDGRPSKPSKALEDDPAELIEQDCPPEWTNPSS
jgi:hypothetical protein